MAKRPDNSIYLILVVFLSSLVDCINIDKVLIFFSFIGFIILLCFVNRIDGSIPGRLSPGKGFPVTVLGLETLVFIVFVIFTLNDLSKGFITFLEHSDK